jgi:mannobiose 2-epimerase
MVPAAVTPIFPLEHCLALKNTGRRGDNQSQYKSVQSQGVAHSGFDRPGRKTDVPLPPMDAPTLLAYGNRIEKELLQNILPFWMREVADVSHGGFHGELSNDLVINRSAPRGSLLTSRILWTFSAACQSHPEPAYLKMADLAYTDLLARFDDPVHGGFYWSVTPDGRPLQDRKQIYGQAFGIYALTEYHRASGRREPLDGGYFEAYARDWSPVADQRLSAVDLNEPKSQNTHLHVMEACTNLLRVWPDAGLRDRQTVLVELMIERILNPVTRHLGLFFNAEWELRSDRISYGHDIEAAWLLGEAAGQLGNAGLTARVNAAAVAIADVTLREGVDADGAIFNEGGPGGITDARKEWWPQAEAVVGFLHAARLAPADGRYLAAALHAWDFIEQRLIDRAQGEWFRGVNRDGSVIPAFEKVGFWKCPYHNARTCLEAAARLRALARG